MGKSLLLALPLLGCQRASLMEGVQPLPQAVSTTLEEDIFVRQTQPTGETQHPRSPESPEIRRPRPLPVRANGWAGNIRVLASCGQDHDSLSNRHGSFYTTVLTQQMRLHHTGFQECHSTLEQSGFLNGVGDVVIFPTSTPSPTVGWRLQEPEKKRFALLVGALDPTEEKGEATATAKIINQAIPQDLGAIQGVLTDPELYGLPEHHVKTLVQKQWQDEFSEGVTWLQEQLRNNPNSEGLVYYSGHQKAEFLPQGALEGDALAEWPHMKMDEQRLKDLFNQAFCVEQLQPRPGGGWECPPILFVVDSCSAGALAN